MYEIGYALAPHTASSFIKPSLIDHANQRGIRLIPIDQSTPLLQQGPFHCIFHKLYSQDWNNQLLQFSAQFPHVPIIDPPQSIQRIHDRLSMLQAVTNLKIHSENVTVGIPNQTPVYDSNSLTDPAVIGNLKFPVIAKSTVANGSDQAHKMKLIFKRDGLESLTTPTVLQEFVNHGGVIFKVYVMGKYVNCVKRNSLPDITLADENMKKLDKSATFSKVSEELSSADRDEMPELNFVEEMARGLREEMGIQLFNFDMIRDSNSKERNTYFVIDINYFPGYDKMTGYESLFTDFLLEVVTNNNNIADLDLDDTCMESRVL